MKTWNRERKRTRDRLLDYDLSVFPIMPSNNTNLPFIYPWENTSLAILEHQIFKIAQNNGYTGSENLLFSKFNNGTIQKYDTIDSFPINSSVEDLYLDTTTGILYYYISTTKNIDVGKVAIIGGAIVGYSVIGDITETHLYLPIRALPIENLIYNCGDAAEYID